MEIRAYEPEDFEGIAKVIASTQVINCWPKVFPNGWSRERIEEEFAPVINRDYANSVFLVAEQNGELVGLIAGHDLVHFIENEIPHLKEQLAQLLPSYYQRDIIITPEAQRGTLGLRLFKALKERAKKLGYSRLITRTPLQNKRGKRFFERLGYVEILQDNNPERIYFSKEI